MGTRTVRTSEPTATRWHLLLGAVLDSLLRPVGIDVLTELPVMKTPPTADILLLRRHAPAWSPEQMARLPDGIRDTTASRILIEFKYTESVNEDALCQCVGYDYFYRMANEVKGEAIQSVLISSKTPHTRTLKQSGYECADHPGVFRSKHWVIRKVWLLSLNDLSNTPHNAAFKCFASRRRERLAAFETLHAEQTSRLSEGFWWIVNGLWNLWFFQGGEFMSRTLTPEAVTEMGKMWGEQFLASLSVEQRLAGLKPEEVLRNFKPEEVLRNFKPEEVLRNFKPEDIERYLRQIKRYASDT